MVLNLETLTGAGWGLGVGWGRWIRGSGGGGRGLIHDLLNSCLFQEFSHEGSFIEEKKTVSRYRWCNDGVGTNSINIRLETLPIFQWIG